MKKFLSGGYLILVLAFIYAPIFVLIAYSFTASATVGNWTGFSLELYREFFNNKEVLNTVLNTLLLAFGSAVISTVLGTMGAIGIYYSRGKFGKLVNGMSQIPVINAEIVTAISLALFFATIFGGKSYFALISGHVLLSAPFVVLSVIPKLKQMDSSLYEAALDLGASPFKALIKVVIPQILPGIFSGFMLSITLSLDDYLITAFTKPDGFKTISTLVYDSVKAPANSPLKLFRVLTVLIFVAVVIIVIIMNVRASRKNRANERAK